MYLESCTFEIAVNVGGAEDDVGHDEAEIHDLSFKNNEENDNDVQF